MDGFLQIIKNITFYLLLVGFVLTFLGDSVYKKYVQFFMGIVLILIIFSPIMKLLSLDTMFQSKLEIGRLQLEESEQKALESANHLFKKAENVQEKGLEEKYQDMIKKQINQSLKEYPVNVNKVEIELGEEVGTLKRIKIVYEETISKSEDVKQSKEEIVNKVEIDKINIEKNIEKMEKEDSNTKSILEEKIVTKMEELYQLSRDAIVLEKK